MNVSLMIAFSFVEKPMSWQESDKYCKEMGARLIEINSKEENAAIVAEIKRRGYNRKNKFFWIGMTDKDEEGIWKLASNDKNASYLNWGANGGYDPEPNNYNRNEHCALLRTGDCSHFHWVQSGWADYNCGKTGLKITCTSEGFSARTTFSINALCEYDTNEGEILKISTSSLVLALVLVYSISSPLTNCFNFESIFFRS